jgi:hypothetical protein
LARVVERPILSSDIGGIRKGHLRLFEGGVAMRRYRPTGVMKAASLILIPTLALIGGPLAWPRRLRRLLNRRS